MRLEAINCLVCKSQFCHEKWGRCTGRGTAKNRMDLRKSVKISVKIQKSRISSSYEVLIASCNKKEHDFDQ